MGLILTRFWRVFEISGGGGIWTPKTPLGRNATEWYLVRAPPGLMHLGLKTGPLCPIFYTKLEELCPFNKDPDGPYI